MGWGRRVGRDGWSFLILSLITVHISERWHSQCNFSLLPREETACIISVPTSHMQKDKTNSYFVPYLQK